MSNQGTLGSRLRQAREQRKFSLETVGRSVGVTAQAVQQWEKDRTVPDPDRLQKVSSFLGCNVTWLITGRELPEQVGNVMIRSVYHLGGRPVPKLTFKDVAESRFDYPERMFINTHFPCSDRSYALPIEDMSNAPEFLIGDSIVIDPELHPMPGDMVLALIRGEAMFRRYKVLSKAPLRFLLEPINPLWSSDEGQDIADILGVMSEHTRPRRR